MVLTDQHRKGCAMPVGCCVPRLYMSKIYNFILSKGILSEAHKEELKTKRGFNDDNIKRNKFFSGGKYLLNCEQELIDTFEEEELLDSGVCCKSKYLYLTPILLEEKIIIPYLDKDANPYFLRPHKLGLKDVSIEIYQELNIGREIILTEGEFKAAAAQQLGFSAIALPGVGSFSDLHSARLIAFLSKHKVKKITIMFDNEVKDSPIYSDRYKEDPMKRYDTQYYAFYMAELLSKENFDCRIAWLPDSWRENGKIDIDGALAQGKTFLELTNVVQRAKERKSFFKELPDEVQVIIRRKLAKKKFRKKIHKEFGMYYATRYRGKTEWEDVISNFTIKITATHKTIEGIIRNVIFINEFGQKTAPFSLGPEEMSRSDSFSTFCLSHGNYIWRGSKDDLSNIWELLFLDDDERHIEETDFLGGLNKIWLFGNVSFRPEDKNERVTAG